MVNDRDTQALPRRNSPAQPRTVYLFTECYPWGGVVETFITDELAVAARMPEVQIVLVPFKRKVTQQTPLPTGVRVDTTLCDRPLARKLLEALGILGWSGFYSWLFAPLLRGRIAPFPSPIRLKRLIATRSVARLASRLLAQTVGSPAPILYSYWYSYPMVGLARAARHSARKALVVARAHRYEIIQPESHFPLRLSALRWVERIYGVSEANEQILRARFPQQADRFATAYLGVSVQGYEAPNRAQLPPEETCALTLLSCSNLIPVKRVELIANFAYTFAETHPNLRVQWEHFGDGEPRAAIETQLSSLPQLPNFSYTLHGMVRKPEILLSYAQPRRAILVNTSTSEGLPVSMMEAIAMGIPLVGTDVGGVREIILPKSGYLLPATPQQADFNHGIETILADYPTYSRNAQALYQERFSPENYSRFYRVLVEQAAMLD